MEKSNNTAEHQHNQWSKAIFDIEENYFKPLGYKVNRETSRRWIFCETENYFSIRHVGNVTILYLN